MKSIQMTDQYDGCKVMTNTLINHLGNRRL